MKNLAAYCLLSIIPFSCSPKKEVSVSTQVPSQQKVDVVVERNQSKVSAALEVAELTNQHNPDGPAKTATAGVIAAGRAYANWPISNDDRVEFQKLANKYLKGQLEDANQQLQDIKQDAIKKDGEIQRLKQNIEAERISAQNEINRKIKEASAERQILRDRFINAIFFGVGALCVVAGIVILVLGGQYAAIYPTLGPKAGFCAIGAGLVLISIGIAINAIERALDNHPWIVGIGCGVSILLLAIAGAMIYSNHHHVTTQQKENA